MKKFTLKMHKKELMKKPAFRKAYNDARKIKPIVAWAVVRDEVNIYEDEISFDGMVQGHLEIFSSAKRAKYSSGGEGKVIKVRITPI